jgi:hypothetical protein
MLKREKGDRQFRSVGQKSTSETKDDWMSEEEHQRAPATATSDQPADPLFQRV